MAIFLDPLFYSVFFSRTGGKRERKEEGRLCRDIFSDMHKFSDQHVTSPDSDTTEPFVKIMRITEMIANARSSDCSTISPCQYQGKFIAKSVENMNTDVWVLRVNDQVSLHRHSLWPDIMLCCLLFSVDTFRDFLKNYFEGNVEPFIKSEEVPETNDGPVTVGCGFC